MRPRPEERGVVVDPRVVGRDDEPSRWLTCGSRPIDRLHGDRVPGDGGGQRPVAEESPDAVGAGAASRGRARPGSPTIGSRRPSEAAKRSAEDVIRPVTSETRIPRWTARPIAARVRSAEHEVVVDEGPVDVERDHPDRQPGRRIEGRRAGPR